jgi:hypothetical protein
MFDDLDADPVAPPARDRVSALNDTPTIVSVSDIHGYLSEARSALLALGEHPDYDPIVETAGARRLQWAGNDEYVLVINGDLIDRGVHSGDVVGMAERLIKQAPPGHVRVTFGNHEMGVLTPDVFDWGDWYSTTRTDEQRRGFVDAIRNGHVVAAYEGYNATYAHAGLQDPYDVADLNEAFLAGAEEIEAAIGADDEASVQEQIITEYPEVYGLGGETGRGPGAGIAWLDFEYLPGDAPPQVVGHTRQDAPIREGNVICENVIRNNRRGDGGEAVVVETPEKITAIGRMGDGSVREHVFSMPSRKEASP